MKKVFLIIGIIITLISFFLIFKSINKKNTNKSFDNSKKLCIKNKSDALNKINKVYGKKKYEYENYSNGLYIYSLKENEIFKEYTVDEKTCEIYEVSGFMYEKGVENE